MSHTDVDLSAGVATPVLTSTVRTAGFAVQASSARLVTTAGVASISTAALSEAS